MCLPAPVGQPLPLTRRDLVVGNFDWTRLTLKQLGLPVPEPPDYPDCLRHLLRRRVWRSTLGEVKAQLDVQPAAGRAPVFIKPAASAKVSGSPRRAMHS
jgi:hypothetical protein